MNRLVLNRNAAAQDRELSFQLTPIDEAAFKRLVRDHGISSDMSELFRQFLTAFVREFSGEWKYTAPAGERPLNRDTFLKILASLKKTKQHLALPIGQIGVAGLESAMSGFSELLNSEWITRQFPESARSLAYLKGETRSANFRGDSYSLDEREAQLTDARSEFVRNYPIQTIEAVLTAIILAIEISLKAMTLQPRGKGGRTPDDRRKWMLANLAHIYAKIKGKPTAGSASKFTHFATDVFTAIGWQNIDVLDSAIQDAVKLWKTDPVFRSG